MKGIFLALFFLLSGLLSIAIAQPGYLGHKNIVRYDVYAMAWPSRNTNQKVWVHNSHELGFERIVSRRSVLGLCAGLLPLYGEQEQLPDYPFTDGKTHRLAVGGGLHLKLHPFLKKGWLAPLGPYVRLSMNFNRLRSTWHAYPPSTETQPWSSHIYMAYGIEFGYSEIFFGRMMVDFGLRFCFADFANGNGVGNIDRRAFKDAEDLFGSEFLKLHLGIGLLL